MPSKHPIALSKSVQGKNSSKGLVSILIRHSRFVVQRSSVCSPRCSCEGLVQALRGGHGGELSDATPVAES